MALARPGWRGPSIRTDPQFLTITRSSTWSGRSPPTPVIGASVIAVFDEKPRRCGPTGLLEQVRATSVEGTVAPGFSPPEHPKQGGDDAAALTAEAQPVTQGLSAPKREESFAPANSSAVEECLRHGMSLRGRADREPRPRDRPSVGELGAWPNVHACSCTRHGSGRHPQGEQGHVVGVAGRHAVE